MLFFAAGGQNLVKRYIVPGSPLHERLKGVPQVRLAPTRSRYVQVDKAGPGFLTLDFLLYARRIEWDGRHMNVRRSGYAACWAAMTGNRPSMT